MILKDYSFRIFSLLSVANRNPYEFFKNRTFCGGRQMALDAHAISQLDVKSGDTLCS